MNNIEWKITPGLTNYEEAVGFMEERVAAIHEGRAPECIWLLEHPPLYTAGTSAKPEDLLEARFPVFKSGRGGEYTYHGPGQRIVYVMLDLKRRQGRPDVKAYVCGLERWVIAALAPLGVRGERRDGRIGVWVDLENGLDLNPSPASAATSSPSPIGRGGDPCVAREGEGLRSSPLSLPAEAKIAAIGVRIKRWVTMHGIAINIAPDLSHFSGIVPCGIKEYGVTSVAELLGKDVSVEAMDDVLIKTRPDFFSRHPERM